MKCPGTDIMQAYIDCELELAMRKDVESHVSSCSKCLEILDRLKENDNFAFGRMNNYKEFWQNYNFQPSDRAVSKRISKDLPAKKKGEWGFMKKYKKVISAACAALVITTCVAVQPVRSAIASTLSIFRVENVKGLSVSIDDIRDIQAKIAGHEEEIDMDKLGKIKSSGGKTREITADEAAELSDLKVMFPSALADKTPRITTVEAESMEFTLNVENANRMLELFGGKELLPSGVDGKTFIMNFPRQVNLSYRMEDEKSRINIMQTKAPEIIVPDGIDVDEIYNSMVELPLLPDDLQQKLKSIKDWKNTLYIPVVEGETEEVDVNGVKGYLRSSEKAGKGNVYSSLTWFSDGTIYMVSGNVDRDEIINTAESMR